MKKSIKLQMLFLLLFVHTAISAQLSVGGLPFSFTTEQGFNNNIPIEIMPPVNVDSLLESDSSTDFLSRFGYAFSVNLNLGNSGIWETMPNGDKVWRLKINCPNAFSVNLIFDNWWLPQGGVFFVYSNNKKMILGGFNDSVANNDENVLRVHDNYNMALGYDTKFYHAKNVGVIRKEIYEIDKKYPESKLLHVWELADYKVIQ